MKTKNIDNGATNPGSVEMNLNDEEILENDTAPFQGKKRTNSCQDEQPPICLRKVKPNFSYPPNKPNEDLSFSALPWRIL